MRINETFERFMEQEESGVKPQSTMSADDVLKVASPSVDFMAGCQVANDPAALAAARQAVETMAAKLRSGLRFDWNGTMARIYDGDELVDRTEIHGVTWDREHREASAVRCDLDGVKNALAVRKPAPLENP
jgi:hypothetical protein